MSRKLLASLLATGCLLLIACDRDEPIENASLRLHLRDEPIPAAASPRAVTVKFSEQDAATLMIEETEFTFDWWKGSTALSVRTGISQTSLIPASPVCFEDDVTISDPTTDKSVIAIEGGTCLAGWRVEAEGLFELPPRTGSELGTVRPSTASTR